MYKIYSGYGMSNIPKIPKTLVVETRGGEIVNKIPVYKSQKPSR